MTKILNGLVAFAVTTAIGVALLAFLGVVQFRMPWLSSPLTETHEVAAPEIPTVVSIEPISLDCRARITAQVPVEGRKEHRVFGQVYRTDTVRIDAIGDIDTCVDAGAVEVIEGPEVARVLVPAEAVQFVRPRVDATATMGSVDFDKGTIGKMTDALWWVEDGESLTAAGYAFAQETIGSSTCMDAAWEQTVEALVEAYRREAIAQGMAPDAVEVLVTGIPDFAPSEPSRLGELDFDVAGPATCAVADAAGGVADAVHGRS